VAKETLPALAPSSSQIFSPRFINGEAGPADLPQFVLSTANGIVACYRTPTFLRSYSGRMINGRWMLIGVRRRSLRRARPAPGDPCPGREVRAGDHPGNHLSRQARSAAGSPASVSSCTSASSGTGPVSRARSSLAFLSASSRVVTPCPFSPARARGLTDNDRRGAGRAEGNPR
jgi:hypothetical protein